MVNDCGTPKHCLLTPGPLTCTDTIRKKMASVDFGSRDKPFIALVRNIREKLLNHLDVDSTTHSSILVQGAGTSGIEAMLSSLIPQQNAKILIVSNGVYGKRQRDICEMLKIPHEIVEYPHHEAYSISDIEAKLNDEAFTHVSVIHHETTAGVINPLQQTGAAIRSFNQKTGRDVKLFVDSMSAAGAYACPVGEWNINCIVSSSNKNYGGVPGFSWMVVDNKTLNETKGSARVYTLDLHSQIAGLDKNGQFRFTPPTHSMVAFEQALIEWEEQGGRQARLDRFEKNAKVLIEGMEKLGYICYVPKPVRGCIITSFLNPSHPKWNFETFYDGLHQHGFTIYPGSMTATPTFRVGSIGNVFPEDMTRFISSVVEIMASMGMDGPLYGEKEEEFRVAALGGEESRPSEGRQDVKMSA